MARFGAMVRLTFLAIVLGVTYVAEVSGSRQKAHSARSVSPSATAPTAETLAADSEAASALARRLGHASRLADTASKELALAAKEAASVASAASAAAPAAPPTLSPKPVEPSRFYSLYGIREKMTNEMQAIFYLLHGITFAIFIKGVCLAGNFLVQTIPMRQVQEWDSRGCTGDADVAPYLAIAFGGWQWCFYGTFSFLWTRQEGFLILVQSNCLGAILGTYYTYCFYRNCRNNDSSASFQKYLSGITFLIVIQMVAICVLPPERALVVSGSISSLCSFIGAISMLVPVPAVIRNKDSSSIPGLLVVAYFLSSLAWCICGCMIHDVLVASPNVVACTACLTCLSLKMIYPEVKKANDEECAKAIKALESMIVTDKKKLGRLPLAKEVPRDDKASHDFQFSGASGYAGGCVAYGSDGTKGAF